jgi:hypothetical protein
MGYPSFLRPHHLRRNALQLGFLAVSAGMIIAAACAKGVGTGFPGEDGGGAGGSDNDGQAPCLTCAGSGGGGGSSSGGMGPVKQSTCTMASPCADFPTAALIDPAAMGVPSNPAGLFSGTPASGGPCLYEPQDGTLYPNGGTAAEPGWVRPRISWVPANGETVFQITLSSPAEKNPYVIYTTNTYWTMDKPTWLSLSANLVGTPGMGGGPQVTVTVAGTTASGGSVTASSPASFTIASLAASGALIYWSTQNFDNNASSTELKGFHVGDEGTTVALQSTQVQEKVVATQADGSTPNPYVSGSGTQPVTVYCIGCHVATPDGQYVAFNAQWPWPSAIASIVADGGAVGAQPSWLTTGALANLNPLTPLESIETTGSPLNGSLSGSWYSPPVINQMMLGVQTFSAAHYSDTDRKVVTTLGATVNALSLDAADTPTGVTAQLAWIDLQWAGTPAANGAGLPVAGPCTGTCLPSTNGGSAGWGVIQRTGDTQSAGAPSWSHGYNNGGTATDVIAYTSVGAGGIKDGRLESGPGAIWTVPYGGGNGGTAAALPLTGASGNQYYPSWSPDDQLIAFNNAAAGVLMYNQPVAEVWIAPYNAGKGGAAVRLAANDPVACTGSASPGVKNTWPKWAPLPQASMTPNTGSDGNLYYWVTFSSTRANECTLSGATGGFCTGPSSNASSQAADALGRAQLYVAGIVVDPKNNNAITTYPAVYLWNQDPSLNNLIPSWEYFPIAAGIQPPVP